MNQEKVEIRYIEEDAIDLRALWTTIVQRKRVVLGIVFLVTLASFIYTWTLKPIEPLYKASALVEIGQSIEDRPFDNVYNLKNIINRVMKLTVVIPKRTNALLLLSARNSNEELAKQEVQVGVDFIINRHKEMVADYAIVRMTQVIGNIEILDIAKQPKKKLIVAVSLISSLIFSLFLVFFLEFIRSEEQDESYTV